MSNFHDDHGFEFEFCRVLEPGASPDAPADHLFSNGRLVPHDFPCSPRSVSQRTSSFGSFSLSSDSLSRSGSQRSSSFGSSNSGFEAFSSSGTDSCSWSQRSSTSISSSRTSISDATPEKPELFHVKRAKQSPKLYYGSQKWQFIAPVSVLNGNVRHRSKKYSQRKKSEVADHQKVLKSKNEEKSCGFWRRFLCLFVSTCNEFHAIEPSTREKL